MMETSERLEEIRSRLAVGLDVPRSEVALLMTEFDDMRKVLEEQNTKLQDLEYKLTNLRAEHVLALRALRNGTGLA